MFITPLRNQNCFQMDSERIVRVSAPAKINLGLHVLGKRPDGFHDIETVFVAIGWSDELVLRPFDKLEMTCSDPGLPIDESNLCMAAASLFAREYNVGVGASIHLEKHIPYGAGLGGGSSDAAATLLGLQQLWGISAVDDGLIKLAEQLGSDVPFFLDPRASIGRGRGEILKRLEPLCLPNFVTVIVPDVRVSTAEAYANLAQLDRSRPNLEGVIVSSDLSRWKSELKNEFEASIFRAYPELGEIKRELYGVGAAYVAMSGSGSAVFGLFHDERGAAEAAQTEEYRCWWGRILE